MNKPDYRHSIMNVSRSFLKHYGCYQGHDTIESMDQHLKRNHAHVIYMLLDGLGDDLMKRHLPEDAFLRRHQKDRITSVFPPTTVAATNAVLAAKPPISTGYLGWIQYFAELDMQGVVFMNEDYYTKVKSPVNFQQTYLSYETIVDQIAKAHPNIHCETLFPDFVPGGSKTFQAHLDKLKAIQQKHAKSFSYVYWTSPDLEAHMHGIDGKTVHQVIVALNDAIEQFTLELSDDTMITIIADHGMIDVKTMMIDQDEVIMSSLIRMPSFEPRATNFFIKKECLSTFETHFKKTYGKYFQLLSKDEIMKMALFGQESPHPKFASFLGDYVAIAIDCYMFGLSKGVAFKAHHAGLTESELWVPLIIYAND